MRRLGKVSLRGTRAEKTDRQCKTENEEERKQQKRDGGVQ